MVNNQKTTEYLEDTFYSAYHSAILSDSLNEDLIDAYPTALECSENLDME